MFGQTLYLHIDFMKYVCFIYFFIPDTYDRQSPLQYNHCSFQVTLYCRKEIMAQIQQGHGVVLVCTAQNMHFYIQVTFYEMAVILLSEFLYFLIPFYCILKIFLLHQQRQLKVLLTFSCTILLLSLFVLFVKMQLNDHVFMNSGIFCDLLQLKGSIIN